MPSAIGSLIVVPKGLNVDRYERRERMLRWSSPGNENPSRVLISFVTQRTQQHPDPKKRRQPPLGEFREGPYVPSVLHR